jgi:hypothetical protein
MILIRRRTGFPYSILLVVTQQVVTNSLGVGLVANIVPDLKTQESRRESTE